MLAASRCAPPLCVATSGRTAPAAQKQRQARRWGGGSRASSSSSSPAARSSTFGLRWQAQHYSKAQLPLARAAADSGGEEEGPADDAAADELPLWRFLRQQGFSADSVSRMQVEVSSGKAKNSIKTGQRFTEQKLQRDVASNIAALRAEGLDTASIERLFEQRPVLLTATHSTLSSALAALRQLAALLPDDPRAVQAPPGATQLGVALWLYPGAAANLLTRANLGSLVDGNLQLRRQLGISDAQTAAGLFCRFAAIVSNFERAEAMVAHLQRLQASGALSAEQVTELGLSTALNLTPAEFDRRWQEGGPSALKFIGASDPAGRQRAAAEALGELLQATDGVPGPLQPQYRQQGVDLVERSRALWASGPAALRASWASLQQLGLGSSQVVAVVQQEPAVLTYDWEAEAKQRLLAWVQQELGLTPFEFLTCHAGYATYSIAKIAMRADFLRQHRPAVWEAKLARGTGPVLSLLTDYRTLTRLGCTKAELDAFNRTWLATPAGRHWGGRTRRVQRRTDKSAAEA